MTVASSYYGFVRWRCKVPFNDRFGYIFVAAFSPDNKMMLIPLTALLLILVPIAFNSTFFLLQKAFAYPYILRQPTETILRRFQEGGAPLHRH